MVSFHVKQIKLNFGQTEDHFPFYYVRHDNEYFKKCARCINTLRKKKKLLFILDSWLVGWVTNPDSTFLREDFVFL